MSIAGDLIRGHTDAIILARLLQSDSYGYEINKVISTLSSGRFELKEATLYTAFKRLEETGYIVSYWGASGAGARRRYYTITPAGREACRQLLAEWTETIFTAMDCSILLLMVCPVPYTSAAQKKTAPTSGTMEPVWFAMPQNEITAGEDSPAVFR